MEINLKSIFASIGFLVTLIGSIPVATSAPDKIYTDRVEKVNPAIYRDRIQKANPTIDTDRVEKINPAIIPGIDGLTGIDRNPNGAQVRVTYQPGADEKLSCNETKIEITIVGDLLSVPPSDGISLVPQPNEPRSYQILGSYTGTGSQVFAGNAGNNCLYNFNLMKSHVGKKALVTAYGPILPSRYSSFGGSLPTPVAIKSPRQVFSLKTERITPPN